MAISPYINEDLTEQRDHARAQMLTRLSAGIKATQSRVIAADDDRRRRRGVSVAHVAAGRCGRISFMRVYLGSDHGGYELKQAIVDHLTRGRARADRLRCVCI